MNIFSHIDPVTLRRMPGQGRRILIITPIFHTMVGGAAVYYKLLSEFLVNSGHEVAVISDCEIGRFNGHYIGLFPTRSGRNKQRFLDVLKYAWQNINYLQLPGLINRIRPDTVLIHSSFLNFPGLFPFVLSHISRRAKGIRFILDVRDQLMPTSRAKHLKIVDAFIACSENALEHLRLCGIPPNKIFNIPIPLSLDKPERRVADALIAKHNLRRERYIFYCGAVKESKGVDVLLDAYLNFFRNSHPDCPLVIVGPLKTANERIIRDLAADGVQYIGALPNRDAVMLGDGSLLCINLSRSEGMPRSSLEQLAMRKRVLLPPNVPEFERLCPEYVVQQLDAAAVAIKMEWAIGAPPAVFPFERHDSKEILAKYSELFQLSKFRQNLESVNR